MSESAKATIDHEGIRKWVEDHGGHPACVRGTGGEEDAGLIRIDFPGYSGEEKLKQISWEEWFEKFDEKKLAFLYQEGKEESRFNKLVNRDSVDVREHSKR